MSQKNCDPGRALTNSLDSPSKSWVQKTPEVCGGDACICTTRIPIWSLVEARRLGVSDQELLNHYDPPLTQTDLDTAWAYFENHRDEIEQAIRENEDA